VLGGHANLALQIVRFYLMYGRRPATQPARTPRTVRASGTSTGV
jgi:hypothetical protein